MSSHGKHHKRRRGCHKRATSPETLRWDSEHLVPKKPAWMPWATYRALCRLRTELDAA